MWDLPGPGIEPVSPALAGGFPTTVPPGKPLVYLFNVILVKTPWVFQNEVTFDLTFEQRS